MPGLDGLAVQAEITRRSLPLSIVFLSGAGQVPDAVDAMRAGAVDFLGKPFRREALHAAMIRAEVALQRRLLELERREKLTVLDRLTLRETEVLNGLAAGLQTKMIAHRLNISTRTVEMHRSNITAKLGTPISAVLVLAQEAGLLRSAA